MLPDHSVLLASSGGWSQLLSNAALIAAMDSRLIPLSDSDRELAKEVYALHELWRRGPPPNRRRNPSPNPGSDLLHPIAPSFKKKQPSLRKFPVGCRCSHEASISPSPPVDPGPSWAALIERYESPPRTWVEWEVPNPVATTVTLPDLTPEKQARINAANAQSRGMWASRVFFSKMAKSDEEDDDDDGDGDDDDSEDEEEEGVGEFEMDEVKMRPLKFFIELFEEDESLREYYEKNNEKGEFACLACQGVGSKGERRFTTCNALVQHAHAVAKTKRKTTHRAFARAICKVLGFNPSRLPNMVVDLGGTLGQSLAKTAKAQKENAVEAKLPEGITENVEAKDDNLTEKQPEI